MLGATKVEPATLYSSNDGGIKWQVAGRNTGCVDECALFYNTLRSRWTWSFRENTPNMDRVRRYQV